MDFFYLLYYMDSFFTALKQWSEQSIIDEVIIIAVLIAICESVAQNFIKNSPNKQHTTMFFGLTFYILVGFLLHHAYNNYPLSKVNITWSCLSIVISTLLGYFLYNETITYNTLISVTASLIAVYFISL